MGFWCRILTKHRLLNGVYPLFNTENRVLSHFQFTQHFYLRARYNYCDQFHESNREGGRYINLLKITHLEKDLEVH